MNVRSTLLAALLAACSLPVPGDDDGDGLSELDGDCDDTDASVGTTLLAWPDGDGDGYGDRDAAPKDLGCDAPLPAGFAFDDRDCDDGQADVNPDAEEICANADEDCDGLTNDEDEVADYHKDSWRQDADNDGFFDEVVVRACDAPGTDWDRVGDAAVDCDDDDRAVSPEGIETCNGIDDDCDEEVDEGVEVDLWPDDDDDGFGDDTQPPFDGCETVGYVTNGDDCDDDSAEVSPDAVEICDEVDNNCIGGIDEGVQSRFALDIDGDGFGNDTDPALPSCIPINGRVDLVLGVDCDDADEDVFPGAPETCDGVDNDCDTYLDDNDPNWVQDGYDWFQDQDGDGFGDPLSPAYDCSPPPPGWSDNAFDCDDTDANTTFDYRRYEDVDGDEVGNFDVEVGFCGYEVFQPGYASVGGDCALTDPAQAQIVDSCNVTPADYCGARETTCTTVEHVAIGGWVVNYAGWLPQLGLLDGDALPDVALGTFDLRRDFDGVGDPDQRDFADEVRVLYTTGLDLVTGTWDVDVVSYVFPATLGTDTEDNRGGTKGVIANFDPASPDGELVVVSGEWRNPTVGAVWLVADPPTPVDGAVVQLADVGVGHRIAMPPADVPSQRELPGFAVLAGDLDRDGADDFVLTAPSLYDDDFFYVVPGPSLATLTSLEDANVVEVVDDGFFADLLGVNAAFTPSFDATDTALALTALGSNSDGPAALVFEGLALTDDTSVGDAWTVWYTTDWAPAPSLEQGPRITWGTFAGDAVEADLVMALTDNVRARVYVFHDVVDDAGSQRVAADTAADVVLDLPYPDCIDVAVTGSELFVACSGSPIWRGISDRGLVFRIDLTQFPPSNTPVAITTDNSDQLAIGSAGAIGTLRSPVVFPLDATTDVVVFDHFASWADEAFSWLTVP